MQASDQPSPPKPIDWDALHAGYVRGDDARAAELFGHITHDILPRILAKYDPSLNEDQIRELVARINHKLHAKRRLHQYKGPQKFLGWLRQLAINERADYFRELQKRTGIFPISKDDPNVPPLEGDDGQGAPSSRHNPREAAQEGEIKLMIATCLGRLSNDDREVIERRLQNNETYEQIAASTGVPADKAYLRFFRARSRLAACLEKSGAKKDLL